MHVTVDFDTTDPESKAALVHFLSALLEGTTETQPTKSRARRKPANREPTPDTPPEPTTPEPPAPLAEGDVRTALRDHQATYSRDSALAILESVGKAKGVADLSPEKYQAVVDALAAGPAA